MLDPYQNRLKPVTGSDWRQMALWSGTSNYCSTSVTPANGHSCMWELNLSGYGGISIGRDMTLSSSIVKSITIIMQSSSNSPIQANSLTFMWNNDGNNDFTIPVIPSGTWTNITVPVNGAANVPTSITQVGFKNLNNGNVRFFVDTMQINLMDGIVPNSNGVAATSESTTSFYRQPCLYVAVVCLLLVMLF